MISKAKRKAVYDKYGGHCAYCGKQLSIKELTVDHIMPTSHGGKDNIENLRASCKTCNNMKGEGSIRFLRLALAWPSMVVPDMVDFATALNASKKYKFYYETY
jgi:hypothetical protein